MAPPEFEREFTVLYNRDSVSITVEPLRLYMLMLLIQLGARHPHVNDEMYTMAVEVINKLKVFFEDCPEMLDVLSKGWDSQYDV